jgi:hypothetical protein
MKKFYENYSHVSYLAVEESNGKLIAQEIQNHVDTFEAMREKKKQDEIERLRLIEERRLQKLQEEEEVRRKKAEEEAEALRKVKNDSLDYYYINEINGNSNRNIFFEICEFRAKSRTFTV